MISQKQWADVNTYFQMDVLCPRQFRQCIYWIPHTKKYVNTLVDKVVESPRKHKKSETTIWGDLESLF